MEECFLSAVQSDYTEPTNWKEMMKRPEEENQRWIEGCKLEFEKMQQNGVWEVVNLSDVMGQQTPSGN